MSAAARRKSKKKAPLLLYIWGASFALIVIFFALKFNDIRNVLKETGFFTKVFGHEPSFISQYDGDKTENIDDTKKDAPKPLIPFDKILKLDLKAAENVERDAALASTEIANITSSEDIKPLVDPNRSRDEDALSALIAEQSRVAATQTPHQENSPKSVQAPNPQGNLTEQRIWFVEILADGIISRKSVIKNAPKTSSPLASAVNMLLAGPTGADAQKKMRTLIPEGVRLLSESVFDGVAVLNFSDEFAYNRYGVEGYLTQLMQIVYTATEIAGIDSVQFLIDGELTEYLGGEGVWIGSPLSRSSFR